MAANNDMMRPEFMRLVKADGHLGALYNPRENVLRFVCRAGTVDFDLTAIAEKELRRDARYSAEQGG